MNENLMMKLTAACEDYLAAAIANPILFVDKPLAPSCFPAGLDGLFNAAKYLADNRFPLTTKNILTEMARELLYPSAVSKMEGQIEDMFVNELFGRAASYKDGCYAWDRVNEYAKRRSLIEAAAEIVKIAGNEKEDIVESWAKIEARLGKAVEGVDESDMETMADSMLRLHEKLARTQAGIIDPTVMSGFFELDAITRGFQPGEFIVIGGRPAMGKTAVMVQIGQHAAQNGVGVALFSMEMGKEGLDRRTVAKEVGLARRQQYEPNDSLANSLDKIKNLAGSPWMRNFFVSERRGLRMPQIRAMATSLVRRNPKIKLIMIDYLQLARGDAKIRHEEIAELSRFFKALAGELGVTVMAAAQLSRALGAREDRRPKLTDLRESGQIEQDADMVIFVHRENYYDPAANPKAAELIVAKNRNDVAPTIHVGFDGASFTFTNDVSPWDGPPGTTPFDNQDDDSAQPRRKTLAEIRAESMSRRAAK